jgi:hypothetical protein
MKRDMKAKYILAILLLTGLFLNGCVKDKIFEGPPVLSNLVLTPQAPLPSDAVTVAIKVTDMNGIKAVILYYKVETGSYVPVPMTQSGENIYSGGIPKQDGGVSVTYYIEAENTVGKKGYHPTGAPETTAAYTVGAPSIVINEVYSRGVPAEPDWVEIYNNSDVVVDISGYKIYDAGGQSGAKPKKEIPAGTVMQARAFFAMSTEGAGEPSDFGLSSGGEEVWLESPKGTIVDNVAFTAMDVNQSFGRMPDGSQNLQLLQTITRGAANDNTPPAAVIKLNEIYSRGIPDAPDWIELYNTSTFAADISGYKYTTAAE